jgi:integrase
MAQKRTPKLDPSSLPRGIRQGKDSRFHWEVDRIRTDGSRFRKAGSAKTAEDALERFNAALAEFEGGESSNGRTPTFGEWAEYAKTQIFPVAPSRSGKPFSPRTVQGYVGIIEGSLKPLLGDILLDRLTPEHVEAALVKIGGEPQTRLNVRNLGSKLYEIAARRGKVPQGFNPFKAVQIAKPKRKRDDEGHEVKDARVLTHSEEEALLSKADGHWCYGAILLACRLGLRMGEVLGLEWADVDFEAKTVTIRQQRQRITKATRDLMGIKSKGGLMKVDPKSEWGFRMIPLPASVLAWLKEERARNESPFIIPNELGNNPKEPRRLTGCFNAAVAKAEIKPHDAKGKPLPMPTFHDLRHTWCTRMATEYKVLPNVLMRLAGHSRVETTLGFYVHSEEADLFGAMANIK